MKETIKLTRSDVVEILDQTKLPFREKIIATTNYIEIIKAIKQLSIRGAPAIGVAGAFAAYLALKSSRYRQYCSYGGPCDITDLKPAHSQLVAS